MAFIVEDGTGLSDANSYTSVEFADAYFDERGNTAWTGTTSQKQSWLIQATDYINFRFGLRFDGERLTETQALIFPIDLYDELPTVLLKATCEYAVRAKNGPLAPDLTYDASGMTVIQSEKKVGPLEVKTKFASGGGSGVRTKFRAYPAADALLTELFKTGDSVIRS